MKKRVFLILTVCLLVLSMSMSAFAHSGRTDSSGGHRDNKNKSGLGSYHYHCGGHPAHLHNNGVCPYASGASSSNSSSSGSSSSNTSSSSSAPKMVYATSIKASHVPSQIYAGETAELKASFYPENTTDKTIEWKSSDESVISVSASGEITANKPGTATITAVHKELADSMDIEVKPIDAKSIEIILPDDAEKNSDGVLMVNKGAKMELKAEITPENATYKEIEWSVSDEGVAVIDENGVLTANEAGTVVVTATAKSGVTEEIEIEIGSDSGSAAAGVLGAAVIGGGGGAWYYRRKKKKAAEAA